MTRVMVECTRGTDKCVSAADVSPAAAGGASHRGHGRAAAGAGQQVTRGIITRDIVTRDV